jgi:hypothetical protein
MTARRLSPPATWIVTIERHAVSRWFIGRQVVKLPAPDSEDACLTAIRWAHGKAGVPPWRPLIRESLKHTTAKRTGSAPVAPIALANCQLELTEPMAA